MYTYKTYKKETQKDINEACLDAYRKAINEYSTMRPQQIAVRWEGLRTCTAEVLTMENYYILRSYNTFVAVIDKRINVAFDVLRYVYGYTSTSAQHIRKFCQDYGAQQLFSYRPVKE